MFVDIRADTLNIDESLIEAAITPRTRAIVPVHYAGVACEMDAIVDIARAAWPAASSRTRRRRSARRTRAGRSAASAHSRALSFHETKNVISGEGGALLVNDASARASAPRSSARRAPTAAQFFRGEVDKYTWVDIGSSYLPSELIAAFLWAQLEEAEAITARRAARCGERYHDALRRAERAGRVRRPIVPRDAAHNAHMLLPAAAATRSARSASSQRLRARRHRTRCSTTCRCTLARRAQIRPCQR